MAQGNYTKRDDEIKVLKASKDYLEKKCWMLEIENQNLTTWIAILGITTMVSIIGVLVLFFQQ